MKTRIQSKQPGKSPIQAKAGNQANKGSILQAYKQGTTQLAAEEEEPAQLQENKTGLPDNLKSGVENLSGHSLDDVKVHYNSSQPAALQAHAYAQGTDIHVAPGQEKHLPHEAWHVVQQKQGRVQPTRQLKGKTNINDDAGLEKEADVMGAKALLSSSSNDYNNRADSGSPLPSAQLHSIAQLTPSEDFDEFVADTAVIQEGVEDYEKKVWKPKVKTWSKAEEGLEAWVTETTEAGQRKYAEWRAKEALINVDANIYFGANTTTQADLESSDSAVEVKRTIQDNSGVNSHLFTADQQLYNRQKGKNNEKIIVLEIAQQGSMWPWNGNATKLVQNINSLGNSLLKVLQKIPTPVQVDRLLVSYPNGHANNTLKGFEFIVNKDPSGTITTINLVKLL